MNTCISFTIKNTTKVYGNMTHGSFLILKQNLCRFFQDVRVKVSLFLQSEIQNSDGSFVIKSDGPVPSGGVIPGTIRCVQRIMHASSYPSIWYLHILFSYFDIGGTEIRQDKVELASANGASRCEELPILDRDPNHCTFGENM